MERESFVFYRSFAEAIELLEDTDKLKAYDAIVNYALDGVIPECDGLAKAIFTMAKPQVDANNRRYENGCKGGAPKGSRNNPNGRKGKELTKNKPRTNLELTKNKPNVNDNENVNENVNDNENVNENEQKISVDYPEKYRKMMERSERFFSNRNV